VFKSKAKTLVKELVDKSIIILPQNEYVASPLLAVTFIAFNLSADMLDELTLL
jgi:hypothetical protein